MTRRRTSRLSALALAGALSAGAGSVIAYPPFAGAAQPERMTLAELAERRARAQELGDRAIAAFAQGDYQRAEELLLDQLELDPNNFVPMYNLSVARAQQGDLDEATDFLANAIEHGFTDFRQLETDPHMAAVRGTEFYRRLSANWDEVLDARGEAHFERIRHDYARGYLHDRDERVRVSFAVAVDETTYRTVRAELDLLTAWALEHVFRDLREPAMGATDPWAVVIVPSERDFREWAIGMYGPSAVLSDFHRVGGSYSHDRKELVAMDLGGTLRHEYMHLLHWRSNSRAGQVHPIWIQEGVCSLAEDFDVRGGRLEITPNWRTNMVKRLAEARRLPSLDRLARMSRGDFAGSRPLANYAHARAFFLYLDSIGKLGDWYAHYVERYEEDPSGLESISTVLGKPIDAIDADFQAWLLALPEVAEARSDGTISGLTASLGVQLDPGTGDGPVVQRIMSRSTRNAGVRTRDVVTAIDGRPTRDMNEFVRVLGEYAPGQTVTVSVRRRTRHETIEVVLQPMR